jgi:hypothetical protein
VTRSLRTLWALLNLPSLITLAIAIVLIARSPLEPKILTAMIPVLIAATFALLAAHISRVLQVGIWRLLPGGLNAAVRAVATIVLSLSLLFGTLNMLVGDDLLPGVPLGTFLAYFIHLSLFGFLLLFGIGRQLPRLMCAFYFVPCTIALAFSLRTFEGAPVFWVAGAAICGVLWSVGAFANVRAPNHSHRTFAWLQAVETIFVRADRDLAVGASAAPRLLRLGGIGLGGVLVGIIILTFVSWSQHATMGRLMSTPLPLRMFLVTPISLAALFVAFHASRFAVPARRLWLCWAQSRAHLFRLVERSVYRDAGVVAAAAWAGAFGFALLRGMDIAPSVALEALAAFVGAALTFACAGLIAATLPARWMKIAVAVVLIVAVSKVTNVWFAASGGAHGGIQPHRLGYFAIASLGLVGLRTLAAARWKRIDWSHYRNSRKTT